MTSEEEERFWAKVRKGPGCWEWGAYCVRGYGRFKMDGKTHRAHRIAYSLAYGPIPEGLLVCHMCDNPRCVRPDHLFIGTNADNMADRDRKGRQARGESIPLSKLTGSDVLEIRASSASRKELAEKFGVSAPIISQIQTGKRWKHVGGKLRKSERHLTREQVVEIKRDTRKQQEIARDFGICRQQVSRIQLGLTYAGVAPELTRAKRKSGRKPNERK